MQGVTGRAGIPANQFAGFPGAALFASPDFVGGTLSYSAAPYRLWDNFVRPVLNFLPFAQLGRLRYRFSVRRAIRIVTPVLSLLALLLPLGAVASASASAKNVSPRKRLYAPYLFIRALDMGSPDNDMVKISRESGIKRFPGVFFVDLGIYLQSRMVP